MYRQNNQFVLFPFCHSVSKNAKPEKNTKNIHSAKKQE